MVADIYLKYLLCKNADRKHKKMINTWKIELYFSRYSSVKRYGLQQAIAIDYNIKMAYCVTEKFKIWKTFNILPKSGS